MNTERASLPPPAESVPATFPHETFADRIKLLIKRVGSVTEIARMCGFSEGVVRSWRDGNTDPLQGTLRHPVTRFGRVAGLAGGR